MRTVDTTERIAAASPRLKARMAGVLYALEGTAAVFGGVYLRGKFIVSGNAAATAATILANEPLFRLGFAAALLAVAFHLTYTVLFYDLFRPVNRSLALLAAFFSLVACALQAFAALFQLAALLVVGGGSSLSAFSGGQVQALALLLLNVNAQAFDVYLIFFGFWLIPTGYLIVRSTFFPRIIGVLLMLDGLGWATFLWPPLASYLYPLIAVVAALGELPLLLWLLVVGVNAQRWKEQARAAGASLST
jgi:Domain of unknown function (DUF4386)